jgi:hypothetical protein
VPIHDDQYENLYQKAMRQVAGQVQILIYRRSTTPIRDWDEVTLDLSLRIAEIMKDKGETRRRRLVELAAYAVFSSVEDEKNGHNL